MRARSAGAAVPGVSAAASAAHSRARERTAALGSLTAADSTRQVITSGARPAARRTVSRRSSSASAAADPLAPCRGFLPGGPHGVAGLGEDAAARFDDRPPAGKATKTPTLLVPEPHNVPCLCPGFCRRSPHGRPAWPRPAAARWLPGCRRAGRRWRGRSRCTRRELLAAARPGVVSAAGQFPPSPCPAPPRPSAAPGQTAAPGIAAGRQQREQVANSGTRHRSG